LNKEKHALKKVSFRRAMLGVRGSEHPLRELNALRLMLGDKAPFCSISLNA